MWVGQACKGFTRAMVVQRLGDQVLGVGSGVVGMRNENTVSHEENSLGRI